MVYSDFTLLFSFDKTVVGFRKTTWRRRKEMGIFQLTPDMPFYEDIEDIKLRKEKNQVKLHSHEEVWSE